MKSKIKSIYLELHEGPTVLFKNGTPSVTVTDFDEAQKTLCKWGSSAPRKDHGYNKTSFKITWKNGNEYCGRFDLTKGGYTSSDKDLRSCVLSALETYSGAKKPIGWTQEQYDNFLLGIDQTEDKVILENGEL